MKWHLYGDSKISGRIIESTKGLISFVLYRPTSKSSLQLLKGSNISLASSLEHFLKEAKVLLLATNNQAELFFLLKMWRKFHRTGAKLILIQGNRIGLGEKVYQYLNQNHKSFEVINLYINKSEKNTYKIIIGGQQGAFINIVRKHFAFLCHTVFVVTRKEAEYIHQWELLKNIIDKGFNIQMQKDIMRQGLDIEVIKKGALIYQQQNKAEGYQKKNIETYAKATKNKLLVQALSTIDQDNNWVNQQLMLVNKYIQNKVITVWGYHQSIHSLLQLPYTIQWLNSKQNVKALKYLKNRRIIITDNIDDSVRNSDLLIILQTNEQFASIPLERLERLLRNKVIIDPTNTFDLSEMRNLKWIYISKGRMPIGI